MLSVNAVALRLFLLSLLMPLTFTTAYSQTTGSIQVGKYSKLPLPRFVSLKSEKVNMRVGPGKNYAVTWRYEKAGLPLEIIQEFDNWRRVRDVTGEIGWIHKSLLSGRRAAITRPWNTQDTMGSIAMFDRPERAGKQIATLQSGVIGMLDECDGVWCAITVRPSSGTTIKGYVSQTDLWGAYPDEKFE
ncbi:MAG: SH3 domain-containing protein [Pseudomonadota bacterium]